MSNRDHRRKPATDDAAPVQRASRAGAGPTTGDVPARAPGVAGPRAGVPVTPSASSWLSPGTVQRSPRPAASSFDPAPFELHIQQRASAAAEDPAAVQEAAAQGILGASQPLPHLDRIQASFGSDHDVSGIQAHVGGAATDASMKMGASAYATGNHVAFAGTPDLHTAAHEAAHVIQQKQGVSLYGGVGEAGDRYEQHADAVADRVVAGKSAADLLSPADTHAGHSATQSVQQQAQAAAPVDVAVEWSSPFGSDLDGVVTLYGSNDKKKWSQIGTQTVAASADAHFSGVQYYKHYRATVQPADDLPKDGDDVGQFKKTDFSQDAPAGATSVKLRDSLELNRWNRENVRQRHAKQRIDPQKSDERNVNARPLFGRVVRVHDLLAPRVAATDALYQALPAATKAEITESLFVTGGYAYRNQVGKAGAFSDHSVGMAIDVNANEGKKQNALMEDRNELALLDKIVMPVVRTDPAHKQFDIWQDKGQAQLDASHVFNARFPGFLADLLGRQADVDAATAMGAGAGISAEWIREQVVSQIFASVSARDISMAAKRQKDPVKRQQLELIRENWTSLQAWVLGATVIDKHAGQRDSAGKPLPPEAKTAKGMIPLHETVLQMFLDAGWSWGGDWGRSSNAKASSGRKDYMHFEDSSLMSQIKLP